MNDLDIAFKLIEQILTFWQFYVAGAASVIGWVFSRDKAWSKQKRVGIGLSATMFMTFNLIGLSKTVYSLNIIINILGQNNYEIPLEINEYVFQAALDRLNQGDLLFHLIPHLLVDIIIFYFIFVTSKTDPVGNT